MSSNDSDINCSSSPYSLIPPLISVTMDTTPPMGPHQASQGGATTEENLLEEIRQVETGSFKPNGSTLFSLLNRFKLKKKI